MYQSTGIQNDKGKTKSTVLVSVGYVSTDLIIKYHFANSVMWYRRISVPANWQ